MPRALSAVLTGVAAAALVLAVAAPAAAHNYIVSSTPAEGEVLTALPEAWEVVTNETLLYVGNDDVFGLWVKDSDGLYYGDGCVDVSGAAMSALPAIGDAGDYTLAYALISADGHPLTGEIPFSWRPAVADAEPAVGTPEPTRCGAAEPLPSEVADPPAARPADDTVWWIVAALGGIAAAIVVGVLVSRRPARHPGGSGEGPAEDVET